MSLITTILYFIAIGILCFSAGILTGWGLWHEDEDDDYEDDDYEDDDYEDEDEDDDEIEYLKTVPGTRVEVRSDGEMVFNDDDRIRTGIHKFYGDTEEFQRQTLLDQMERYQWPSNRHT